MISLRLGSKIILSFILAFIVTYGAITLVISQIASRQRSINQKETLIIQQEIQERFNLFLDVTLVIGQISSVYIHDQSKKDGIHYGKLVKKILEEKEYILGLNQLNAEGKIINIYPDQGNQEAMGKVSQNYAKLLASFKSGEKYWFSPPFKLFQEGYGFAFYIPIVDNNKLIGWIAPVISSQLFFDRFKAIDFFNEYDLVIEDGETGNAYFSTGILPEEGNIEEVKSKIRGRNIVFQSWPKKGKLNFAMSFYWSFFFCLLVSIFIAFVVRTHLQKKKAYSRLENISDLLKLTSKEALSKLMDIQSDYLVTGSTGYLQTSVVEKDVHSITNLIEQIDLLQNIAETEQVDEENFELLPELHEQIKDLEDVILKKHIEVSLDSNSFKDVKVTGNRWLISNTVLKNSLSYCVLIARPSSKIKISHVVMPNECNTIFQIEEVYEGHVFETFKIERRLLVARNVMELLNGDIVIQNKEAEGLMLKLKMSAPC